MVEIDHGRRTAGHDGSARRIERRACRHDEPHHFAADERNLDAILNGKALLGQSGNRVFVKTNRDELVLRLFRRRGCAAHGCTTLAGWPAKERAQIMEAASAPMVCGIVTVSTAAVIAATTTTTAAVVVISIIVIGKRSGHGEPGVTQRQGQNSKYPADSCSREEAQ
ncbi:hypothetical protein [Rhizobium laguerreae]|uniref:hypothetical protein n=1 Tax=Rhizobium laguerreae TaxID=1076926 RepID=UPI001FEF4D16|nr:hypothetical protein [Rhizobium laguerreae]